MRAGSQEGTEGKGNKKEEQGKQKEQEQEEEGAGAAAMEKQERTGSIRVGEEEEREKEGGLPLTASLPENPATVSIRDALEGNVRMPDGYEWKMSYIDNGEVKEFTFCTFHNIRISDLSPLDATMAL